MWVNRQGIRSLRRRLGLTQTQLAKLLGVSNLTVSGWERGKGKLQLRARTRAAILSARGLGAREAQARLAVTGSQRRRRAK
jgi:DNA-binding transcriptional regulator YiaG